MTDLVQLYNMALDAAGSNKAGSVTDPAETSLPARVCTRWFAPTRDQVLGAARWPSIRAFSRLALLVERDVDADWVATDPAPGWAFSYSAPSDMLRPWHLSDFSRFIMSTTSTNAIALNTQTENAVLVYGKRQTDLNKWDPQLFMAMVYALASNICMPLNGKRDRAIDCKNEANIRISAARADAANAGESLYESVPDWIAARGSIYSSPSTKFFYPYAPMIAVTEGVGVS